MAYRIAGIDVHKKILAVVVSDVEIDSEFQFERRMFWPIRTYAPRRNSCVMRSERAATSSPCTGVC